MNLEKWLKRFEEVEKFVGESGRRPSRADTAPDEERYMSYWIKDQIRNYKAGKLDPKLYEMLEKVLDNSKTQQDLAWETTYEELTYFLRDNEGVTPKREKSVQETHLAYWLKDQRKALDKNILPERKIEKLDQLKEIHGFDWRKKGRTRKQTKEDLNNISDALMEMLEDSKDIAESKKTL